MRQSTSSWRLLMLAALLPILVLVAIDVSLDNDSHPESFKRFGNAVLTSYIIVGLVLIGNLFFYADSRHRPSAPFVGMFFALGIGMIIAWALISQDDLLLEANSGLRAQMLSNVVHLLVGGTAMLVASLLAVGFTFAAITGRERRILFEEE
ncbi:MAG: hypothetical protein VXX17_05705 [Candidatus Thermoplasmatota archaeon]|nr:hypothetical protein [Candidatus Thermoplasmatota archaeon]